MKISTLALGALISFSVNTMAQDHPKEKPEQKVSKPSKSKNNTKKPKPKSTEEKPNLENLKQNEVKTASPKNCPACGRG
jgi:hypothetical protein